MTDMLLQGYKYFLATLYSLPIVGVDVILSVARELGTSSDLLSTFNPDPQSVFVRTMSFQGQEKVITLKGHANREIELVDVDIILADWVMGGQLFFLADEVNPEIKSK